VLLEHTGKIQHHYQEPELQQLGLSLEGYLPVMVQGIALELLVFAWG